MDGVLLQIGDWIVLSYLIPLVWFIAQFWQHGSWRRSRIRRAFMYQKMAFALVILLIIISNFFPPFPERPLIRLVFFAAAGFFLWLDVVNLYEVQKHGLPVIIHHLDALSTKKPRR